MKKIIYIISLFVSSVLYTSCKGGKTKRVNMWSA